MKFEIPQLQIWAAAALVVASTGPSSLVSGAAIPSSSGGGSSAESRDEIPSRAALEHDGARKLHQQRLEEEGLGGLLIRSAGSKRGSKDPMSAVQKANILKAAAAAVTPGFGKGGHKARRIADELPVFDLVEGLDFDGERIEQRDSKDPMSAVQKANILKAAAAAVTPGFGKGGHKARDVAANDLSGAGFQGIILGGSSSSASTAMGESEIIESAAEAKIWKKVSSTSSSSSSSKHHDSESTHHHHKTHTAKHAQHTSVHKHKHHHVSDSKTKSESEVETKTRNVAGKLAAAAKTTSSSSGSGSTSGVGSKNFPLVKNKSNSSNKKARSLLSRRQRKAKRGSCVKKTSTTVTSSSKTSSVTSSSKASSVTSKSTTKTSSVTSVTSSTKTSTTSSTTKASTSTSTAASSYGTTEATADMNTIMKWAGDTKMMNSTQKTETVAALLSAANRYFPELATRDAVRYLLADIKAESDFNATAFNGGRLDSGASIGLMQVSPSSGAQELPLYMGHALTSSNNLSWSNIPGTAGPLLDYNTGTELNLAALTAQDLFRPWINIHIGAWVQSNLARTASSDPYSWPDVCTAAYEVVSDAVTYQTLNSSSTATTSQKTKAYNNLVSAEKELASELKGASLPRSVLTGLGSWVAGPAVDGDGSYTSSGDDVSAPYFSNIMGGIKVLYGDNTLTTDFLNGLLLTGGLVDFRYCTSGSVA